MVTSSGSSPVARADLAETERRLVAARQHADRTELAEALAVHANALVQHGQLGQARAEVDEVVAIYHDLHADHDEARYAVLAATLSRLVRDFAAARASAQRALDLAPAGTPLAVSATTELGEIAQASGQHADAVAWFGQTLSNAEAAAAPSPARIALLRKRAVSLVALKRFEEADQDLQAARALALAAGDQRAAVLLQVEQVTALQQSGDRAGADTARQQALDAAAQRADHGALAQLYLLEATRALELRNAEAAFAALESARHHALQGVAPLPYMSAAIGLADLADAQGDRLAAYESLARAWVTLADLLGPEPARLAIDPKLQALRSKWGADAFAATKAAYEARRRAEHGARSL